MWSVPFFAPVCYKLSTVRILQISSARVFGGGERHLVDLSREMSMRGHEMFVALRPTNEWQDRLVFMPPERILHVSIRNSFGTFSARRIARFIVENDIDLVHAHIARDYLVASLACRMSKRPRLVLTRHVVRPLKPFYQFALRNVGAAIAVSPVVGMQLERVFAKERISLIPNGIAARILSPEDRQRLREDLRSFHDIPRDVPLIATIGELTVPKGQRDLVLAANEVIKAVPDCRFVIAGRDSSIDQKFRRELKRLVRVLGLEDHFLWLDWLDDITPLLAAADIFVSASHHESFGLTILEAMAAGTPIIATETDGAKGLVKRQEFLVPIKDPLALANKIVWLLGEPELGLSAAKEQQDAAAEMFSLERMIDETENIYRRVLGI
jgi:glycosyltransferase involved in cell wall biosynthesis